MLPKVSVIITTYNRANMLCQALDSVQAQTFSDWELLVINDGSTDSTAEVLETYANRDSRIRIFNQTNQGMSHSRSFGVKNARGQYAAFLDDDDVFYPNKLKDQAEFLEQNPDVDLVYSQVRVTGENHTLPEIWPRVPATDFKSLIRSNTIQPNALLIKMDAFKKWGAFVKLSGGCDDHHMWLRVALYGRISFLPVTVGEYYWHPGNMSRDLEDRIAGNNQVFRDFLKRVSSPQDQAALRSEASHRNYLCASDAMDRKQFKKAAHYFLEAVYFDPAVGKKLAWGKSKSKSKVYQLLRPYLGLLVCGIFGGFEKKISKDPLCR